MAQDPYIKILIVDNSFTKPAAFLGLCVYDPKTLKERVRNETKRMSYGKETLDEKLAYLIEQCQDKVVIYLGSSDHQAIFNVHNTEAEIAARFINHRDEILEQGYRTRPLYEFFKTHLREYVIKEYYTNTILPLVSKEMLEYCDRSGGVSNIRWGYGYIGSFKKKLLSEYVDKELYWIRFVYNREAEKLIADNIGDTRKMAKTKDLKVFYPNHYAKARSQYDIKEVEFIDIFTTDSTTGDFLMLTADKKVLGFSADLTPLVKNLQELDLITAWE
jgi:hypothetical protein